MEEVIFACFDTEVYAAYRREYANLPGSAAEA
jgi:hypothetical protein